MRPPNKWIVGNNWVGWLIWVTSLLALLEIQMNFWPEELTWSALITFVVFVVATSYGLLRFVWYLYYRWYPFTIKYQEKVHYDILRTSDIKTITTGTTEIILRIKPKRPTQFQEIHLRMVNKRQWKGDSGPKRDNIGIVSIQGEGLLGDIRIWTKPDHTNGLHGFFITSDKSPYAYCIAPEEALILTVGINSVKKWDGYLAIKAGRADGHIGYSYKELHIRENR
jgi:hypothetical protein